MECAALVRAIRQGELDRLIIPERRSIFWRSRSSRCAPSRTQWRDRSETTAHGIEDELFALVRRAYPYRESDARDFDAILEMLSEGIAAQRGRYGAYLHRDRVNEAARAARRRLAAITSGGAIPENALLHGGRRAGRHVVGTLDEDFAVESMRGDIMLLGNTSWRIRRVEGKTGRVLVEDAHGAPPTVPFWLGEAPARTRNFPRMSRDLRQEDQRIDCATLRRWESRRRQPEVAADRRMAERGVRPR